MGESVAASPSPTASRVSRCVLVRFATRTTSARSICMVCSSTWRNTDWCGLVPRDHGNTGRRPHNALLYANVKRCVQFINNHAEVNGIPHPAPLRGRDDAPPVFLPATQTYKSVHALYKESCAAGRQPKLRSSVNHRSAPFGIVVCPTSSL
eukprot:scpid43066/ scgid1282/ 